MADREGELINAVCQDKSIHTLLVADVDELFDSHKDIWDFLKNYYHSNKTVPPVEVIKREFDEFDVIEKGLGTTVHHLDALRQAYITRRTKEIMLAADDAFDSQKMTPSKILDKLTRSIETVAKHANGRMLDVNITDVDKAISHYDQIRKLAEENDGVPGYSFGIDMIDSAFPTGIQGGQLIYFFGFSGQGKTFLSEYVATNIWKKGGKPMIISLEMSPEEVRDRAYTMIKQKCFDLSDLNRGYIDEDVLREWGRQNLEDMPDYIVVSNEGVSEVTPRVIQGYIDKYKPSVVAVDYQQLMLDNDKTSAMTPRMNNLTTELKQLAVANNIPIIVVSAVTDDEKGRGEVPTINQLAWSRSLEYAATIAIAVHRNPVTGLMEICIRKNRNGPLADGLLRVDLAKGVFDEVMDHDEEI